MVSLSGLNMHLLLESHHPLHLDFHFCLCQITNSKLQNRRFKNVKEKGILFKSLYLSCLPFFYSGRFLV